MNETLAIITLNPETRHIKDLSILNKNLRFKCRRCATFCCKLGGPKLTGKDVERIKEAGYEVKDFLEPALNSEFKDLPIVRGNLKSREDGSCIFLRKNMEGDRYKCSIYDSRPILCRLYPFDFDRMSLNSIVLKSIPCCRGLNFPDGELVDDKFINSRLLDALLEVMGLF